MEQSNPKHGNVVMCHVSYMLVLGLYISYLCISCLAVVGELALLFPLLRLAPGMAFASVA